MVSELFWGFTAKNLKDAVAEMCDRNPHAIWIGKDKNSHLPIVDFYEYRLENLEKFSNLSLNIELNADQKNRIYSILQREFIAWQYSHIDLHQLVNFYLHWFSSFLVKKNVQKIWFAYVPHQGAELILYYVAKHLNIQTNMFYQSLFKNKAFLINDIDALGHIPKEMGPYSLLSEKITFGFPEQELFYMKNLPNAQHHWVWLYKHIKNRLKNVLKRRVLLFSTISLLHMSYTRKLWISIQSKSAWDEVDLENVQYIYFPLHLQPELTTDPLGGWFGDQAFAIEQLRKKIPDEIAIIVKENPKQSYEWRSNDFFKRIKRLKNVFFVGSHVNTYYLLKNAQAVATITGTAGWEAVIAGKPAIIFGAAWYRCLPGVFDFREKDFCWENIVSFEADFGAVQEKLDRLVSYMPEVIADPHYIAIFPEYNTEKNKQVLIEILSK